MKKSELKQIIKEEIHKLLNEDSGYKMLKFTAKGKLLNDFINDDSKKAEEYHLNTRDENIIQDMGMYINEMYGDNKFTSLEIFALDIAGHEYQNPELGKSKILRKIKMAINKGWVEVVPYTGKFGDNSKDKNRPWLDPEDVNV